MSAMSPRYEFVSVTLETVAFFLVTIELYGKERLTKATDRLRGFLRRLIPWLFRRRLFRLPINNPTLDRAVNAARAAPGWIAAVMYVVIALLALGFSSGVIPYVRALPEMLVGSEPLFNKVLFAIGTCVFVVVAFQLSITALAWTLYLLADFGMVALDKLQFSGVMLLSGTLLFVLAKGMVWWHLLDHLF